MVREEIIADGERWLPEIEAECSKSAHHQEDNPSNNLTANQACDTQCYGNCDLDLNSQSDLQI